eukprot:Selendium_serpulae@DN10664_c0_g1_i1.p1
MVCVGGRPSRQTVWRAGPPQRFVLAHAGQTERGHRCLDTERLAQLAAAKTVCLSVCLRGPCANADQCGRPMRQTETEDDRYDPVGTGSTPCVYCVGVLPRSTFRVFKDNKDNGHVTWACTCLIFVP